MRGRWYVEDLVHQSVYDLLRKHFTSTETFIVHCESYFKEAPQKRIAPELLKAGLLTRDVFLGLLLHDANSALEIRFIKSE